MKKPLLILFGTVTGLFGLDQLTKAWILKQLPEGGSIPIISGFFDIVHVRNPGAAFGSFGSLPDSIRLPFFYLTSLIALGILLFYFFRMRYERSTLHLYLSMILGGALGNIFDRLLHGEVIDFLSFHWQERWSTLAFGDFYWRFKWEWPAFNVADSAITVGVLCLILMKKGGRS